MMQSLWKPISTAPREAVIDVPADQRLSFRLRMGRAIALLCWDVDGFIPMRGCWAMKDNTGEWWNLENEEPVDLDVVGWADLPDEQAQAELLADAGVRVP